MGLCPGGGDLCTEGNASWVMVTWVPPPNIVTDRSGKKCFSQLLPSSASKALKPRGDVTRSPKQGYQWPHK